jgi:hypothetical protein
MVVTRSAILDFHGTLCGARWQLAEVASEERDREGVRATARQITGGPEPVLAIYVDGGGICKKVGAAAVAPGLNAHAQAYLGKETTATVYAGIAGGDDWGRNGYKVEPRKSGDIQTVYAVFKTLKRVSLLCNFLMPLSSACVR